MSKPTATELITEIFDNWHNVTQVQLAARVERVLSLHRPTGTGRYKVCQHCLDDVVGSDGWPCLTVRILDGEEEVSTASVFGGAADKQDDDFCGWGYDTETGEEGK